MSMRVVAHDPASCAGVPGLRGIYRITVRITTPTKRPGERANVHVRHYIGQARDFASRWLEHQTQLIRGTHGNFQLQQAWQRFGPSAFTFEILELVTEPGVIALTLAEQRWMNKYPHATLFNVRLAGTDEYLAARGRRKYLPGRTGPAPERSATHRGKIQDPRQPHRTPKRRDPYDPDTPSR